MTADRAVFITVVLAATFVAGLTTGQATKPKLCPVAEGQTVVSTHDSRSEQICVYASSYGRALRKVKL